VLQRRLTKCNSNTCAPSAAGQNQYEYGFLISFSMHSFNFVPYFALIYFRSILCTHLLSFLTLISLLSFLTLLSLLFRYGLYSLYCHR
jgi:hypothetical protein